MTGAVTGNLRIARSICAALTEDRAGIRALSSRAVALAELRGWTANDYVIATARQTASVP